MNTKRGFTLMEMLVYLGLFAILVGGAVVSAYSIIESNGRTQNKSMIQQEGDFLVAKINWTMSGARFINAPAVGSSGTQLSVTKWDTAPGNPIVIDLSGTDMTMSRGGNPAVILNSDEVKVENLHFIHEYTGGTNPESVTVTFTLQGLTPNGMPISGDFSTTNYVRR